MSIQHHAPGRKRVGFTLIELLVVVSIISLLISIMLPSLRNARAKCKQVYCQNSLRGMGVGLSLYMNESEERLPYVDSALFQWPPFPNPKNWDADPSDEVLYPSSFVNVMRDYIGNPKSLVCPGAVMGYPRKKLQMTYRCSSADNYDGNVKAMRFLPNGAPLYAYSLKYLDGRQYKVNHVIINEETAALEMKKGPGHWYLLRDFVIAMDDVNRKYPHGRVYNQLFLDLSTETVGDPARDVWDEMYDAYTR